MSIRYVEEIDEMVDFIQGTDNEELDEDEIMDEEDMNEWSQEEWDTIGGEA